MLVDSRIYRCILDNAKKLDLVITLEDETGSVIVSSDKELLNKCDPLFESCEFTDGLAHVEEAGKTYLMSVPENDRPMCIVLDGISREIDRCAYLLSAVITEIRRTAIKKPGREEAIRQILLENIDSVNFTDAIRDYHIDPEVDRCVIVVQTRDGDAMRVYEGLVKIFPWQNGDIVVNLNRYMVALVKQVDDDTDMETIVEIVDAMDETVANEMDIEAVIGVGTVKRGLINIRDSFKEAEEAIGLGVTQQNKGRVFFFQRLLLERFLQEVPQEIRKRFCDIAYTDAFRKMIDDEMLQTISALYENNLNLSETARKLYIHRNTLIYRLDKIQKATGLDLRHFEDAMLLKLIIMMGKSLSAGNRPE